MRLRGQVQVKTSREKNKHFDVNSKNWFSEKENMSGMSSSIYYFAFLIHIFFLVPDTYFTLSSRKIKRDLHPFYIFVGLKCLPSVNKSENALNMTFIAHLLQFIK